MSKRAPEVSVDVRIVQIQPEEAEDHRDCSNVSLNILWEMMPEESGRTPPDARRGNGDFGEEKKELKEWLHFR